MTVLTQFIHGGALATATASTLYTITVTVTALTAILAPNTARRRDAREVLEILLRRRDPR